MRSASPDKRQTANRPTPARASRARAKPRKTTERVNQKKRTRGALVTAAIALLRAARSPTVTEVADVAHVSPATAYRYFPNAQSLWEAVLDELGEPKAEDVFAGTEDEPIEVRVRILVERVGFRLFDDDALWRSAARCLHQQKLESTEPGKVRARASDARDRIPMRTGQRMRWIEQALAPYTATLSPSAHRMLAHGLALVIGVEAVITLRDVCKLDVEECKRLTLWASDSLVRAALASSS